MKRAVLYGSIILSILCLTGCGNEELHCTKTDDSNQDLKMIQNIDVTFKKSKVTEIATTMKVEVAGVYKQHKATLQSSLEQQFSSYKNKKGISVNTVAKDDTITLNMRANVNKMDKSTREEFGLLNVNTSTKSRKEAKKEFEKDGFQCK